MSSSIRHLGILTGGGDCPGLNAVIRAVVKTAESYNLRVTGIRDGFEGLITSQVMPLTAAEVTGILPRGGTILGTSNRANPFRYGVHEQGQLVYRDVSDQVIQNMQNLGLDALIVIGGDGSLKIALELAGKGVRSVGIPKTIDNDLSATDTTFGFDTALVTATEALDKLHTTAESHHRIMVLEVMGRYAGWIALEAGLAGGADVILIPEIPFTFEEVARKINARRAQGKKFSIVVVAEGAKEEGGELAVERVIRESFDPIRLGGIGRRVGEALERLTGMETRVTVLGHLQRGGSPTPFDRILATRYGAAAVRLARRGQFGRMVCLRGTRIDSVPLEAAVGEMKRVSPESDLVMTARALGISFGDPPA
ncbi:MAG: ATP-dependent 6-phosphofructokinase [Bacillota bacterium]|nr:ATP-dependent 6-phosphofructokinase [Bacillota bacterium]